MYYKCHKVNFRHGGPNPKNKDDKCFQYAVTVALNCEEIESHPEKSFKY